MEDITYLEKQQEDFQMMLAFINFMDQNRLEGITSIQVLIQDLLKSCIDIFKVDMSSFISFSKAHNSFMRESSFYKDKNPLFFEIQNFPIPKTSLMGVALQNGQSFFVQKNPIYPYYGFQEKQYKNLNALYVPLVYNKQKFFLELFSLKKSFKASDIRLASILTKYFALWIERFFLLQRVNLDFLTGLYNRSVMDSTFEFQRMRADREANSFSVLLMDIDNFKTINDKYGHQIGDKVIRFLANAINSQIRKEDQAIRYGGDEFIIVTPRKAAKEALVLCKRIVDFLKGHSVMYGREPIQVTISVGIVSYDRKADRNIKGLLDRADKALYASKRKGKNCITIYEDEL